MKDEKMNARMKAADRRLYMDDENMHSQVCLGTCDDRSGNDKICRAWGMRFFRQ